MLSVIFAASHLAANCPSARCMSPTNEARREVMLRPPKGKWWRPPSTTWLCLEILWPFLHCIKMRSHQGTAVDLASLLNLTICLWVVGRGWNTGENPQGQWKYASFTQPPTNQHCCLKAKLLLLGTMEDPYTSIVPHEELNLLQHKGLKWKWRLEQEKTVFS